MKKPIDALNFQSSPKKARKFSLNEPTSQYLNTVMSALNKNLKEQSQVIEVCLEDFYKFAVAETRDFSLKRAKRSDDDNGFLQLTCFNVVERGTGYVQIWPKLSITALQQLDKMTEYVFNAYGFKSTSSIVNHAISFKFSQLGGALQDYLLNNDIKLPGHY